MKKIKGLYIMVARTINGRTERFTKKLVQTDSYFDIIIEHGDIPRNQMYELVDYFGEDRDNIKMNYQAKFLPIKGKYVTSIVYPIETSRRRIKRNVEKAFKLFTRHGVPGILLDRVDTHPAVIGE